MAPRAVIAEAAGVSSGVAGLWTTERATSLSLLPKTSGGISASGTEMYAALWVRLRSELWTGYFNIAVVQAPASSPS